MHNKSSILIIILFCSFIASFFLFLCVSNVTFIMLHSYEIQESKLDFDNTSRLSALYGGMSIFFFISAIAWIAYYIVWSLRKK